MRAPSPVRVIAEVGSVHDGSFGNAKRLLSAAAGAGAHVVKYQTHLAEAETLADAPSPSYFTDEPRYDYFRRTAFEPDQWRALRKHADELGVGFLSSPFSIEAVDLLEDIGVDGYKVASGEVTNLPLLERMAETGKEVLLSSGMSSWAELDAAVEVLREGGPVTVLQCSSVYPCPPDRVGLNVMDEMRQRYSLPVGFSDHTQGIGAAVAAVALGASVIEKHFTFSRLMYGSDAPLAAEPAEFARLASAVADVAEMLSNPVDKDDVAPYRPMKLVFEKSIVTRVPLPGGSVLRREDLAFKKPGDGIPARDWRTLLGRVLLADVPADHKLTLGDLQ